MTVPVQTFIIAGAIETLLDKETAMKHLGPAAPKWLSYVPASLPPAPSLALLLAGHSGPSLSLLSMIVIARIIGGKRRQSISFWS